MYIINQPWATTMKDLGCRMCTSCSEQVHTGRLDIIDQTQFLDQTDYLIGKLGLRPKFGLRTKSDLFYQVTQCVTVRQYNILHVSDLLIKLGAFSCAGFVETRPFTSNEAVVQSNQHLSISYQLQLCIVLHRLQQ